MKILYFLLLFPLIPAIFASITGNQKLRGWIIRISAFAIAFGSIFCAWHFMGKDVSFFKVEYPILEWGVFAAEMFVALFLLYKCKEIKKNGVLIQHFPAK